MLRLLHPVAGGTAFLTILIFWLSTVAAELAGGPGLTVAVKTAILWGLVLLVPALAFTGLSGIRLARGTGGVRITRKRRRMPWIAGTGLLVLVPCAVFLQAKASAHSFDTAFVAAQALELVAGATNLALLGLSMRDGFALTGRFARGHA